MTLLPHQQAVVTPPSAPVIRGWRPDSSNVPIAESIQFIHELVERRALAMASGAPDRLGQLVDHLPTLPSSDRALVIRALQEQSSSSELDSAARFSLWEHVDRPAMARALPTEMLNQLRDIAAVLEPQDDPQRFAYLFSWHPELEDVDVTEDFNRYESRVQQRRMQAVTSVLSSKAPFDQLKRLAMRVPVPGQLGWSLAEDPSVSIEDLMPWFSLATLLSMRLRPA